MPSILTRIEMTDEIYEFIRHYLSELNEADYLSQMTPYMTKLYKRVVSFIRAEKNWLDVQLSKPTGWAMFDKEDDEVPSDVAWGLYLSRVMKRVNAELAVIRGEMEIEFRRRYDDTWRRSYTWLNGKYRGTLVFGSPEIAAIQRLGRERLTPALNNNFDRIGRNIERAGLKAKKPDIFIGRIGFLHPLSHEYKGGWLRRLTYTEKHEHLTEAHIMGMEKLGEKRFRRLVTADDVTSPDLCFPFIDEVYSGDSAHGVVPAHPFCRCMMLPFGKTIFVENEPRLVSV